MSQYTNRTRRPCTRPVPACRYTPAHVDIDVIVQKQTFLN